MSKGFAGAEPPRSEIVNPPNVLAQKLTDDGVFPNSSLPLLVYRHAVAVPEQNQPEAFERLFASNGWRHSWRNGIYSYRHYHSTAHEVLGIYRGSARVEFGGEGGLVHDIKAGDVLVIPAGVAHKKLGSSSDFGVVGAYPEGQDWDMNYGGPGERPQVDRNISEVPLPKTDPLFGAEGPLFEHWELR